jgi:preprotein translocase subunit SecF
MHIFTNPNFNFVRWRWHAIALSWVIIIAGLVVIWTKGMPKGVEFSGGTIVQYDKRAPTPRMRHIDYGLGVLAGAALELVPPGQPYDLERLYQQLLARGQLAGYEVSQRFYEAGSFAGLAELEAYLALTARSQRAYS